MKTFLVFAAAFVLGAAVTGSLQAAPAPAKTLVPAKQDAPVNVTSDRFVADLNGKTGTFEGNVLVIQGDMRMRANSVRVTSVNGKADKITANGNVVVDSPTSGTATGDNGVYAVVPRTVEMRGNVVLKKGKDVLRGALLTVNMVTGLATVGGGVKSTAGAPAGRVQGVFTPNTTAPATPSTGSAPTTNP